MKNQPYKRRSSGKSDSTLSYPCGFKNEKCSTCYKTLFTPKNIR